MKEIRSDFLTHKQRVKFVGAIVPLINFIIIPAILFSAENKWIIAGLGILPPIIGITFLRLSMRSSQELLFKIFPIALNGCISFLVCWLAGPASPTFLIGIALIGACTLILEKLTHLIIAIIYALTAITIGCYLGGKTFLDISSYLVLLICYSFIMVRMLFFTIIQGREIMTSHQKIEAQKQMIEEKNRDITDSINYAKRIQQAKLPNKEEIYSSLPNCFVLFKPKDIVSGDFYFFHKHEPYIFIASADCTGHGVPGALMSMIGSEKLEEAVLQSTDTSEILKVLNKGIKTSLRQTDSNESTRDGMDIALCCVDTVERVVKYAGANRPIWIIRNGETTLEEIKATKKAIGGFTDDNQHFDSHEIKFQQGDTFYISTDGYADTFGGKKQKKVTTKLFKKMLLSIQDKSLKEQERHLDNFIEDWKSGEEQVDDILVIGVRL